jgi:uridine phosphorylase
VLCFFTEAIERILETHRHRVVTQFRAESFRPILYEIDYLGEKIILIQAGVGAPMAAGQIEDLTALGCKKFIACGSCGVLRSDLAVGHLIIPTAAVRDEGTSYHYMKPSREVEADPRVVDAIAGVLREQKAPYIKAKTWTTDAFYRETPNKIKQRRAEGCVTVEMEASAFMAVARYCGVEFGQILYAGDTLGGEEWDKRDFNKRTDVREYVLELALKAGLAI